MWKQETTSTLLVLKSYLAKQFCIMGFIYKLKCEKITSVHAEKENYYQTPVGNLIPVPMKKPDLLNKLLLGNNHATLKAQP